MVVIGRDLSDRTREADRQPAARVHIPEECIRKGRAALLAEIPAFEQGPGMFGGIVHRKRAAIDQQRHHRHTRLHHPPHQLILTAGQLERVAVAQVLFPPGFPADRLILTDHQQGHISFAGGRDRLGDQPFIFKRVRLIRDVLVPAEPALPAKILLCDLAALGIQYLHPPAQFLANAIQDADTVTRVSAVTAQVQPGRVRADDCQGLEFLHIQREQAVVLEQHQAFGGGPVGQAAMFGAVRHPFGFGRVGVRIIEQAQAELGCQHPPNCPIHVCFGDTTCPYLG